MTISNTHHQEFLLSPILCSIKPLNTAMASCDALSERIADEANRLQCFNASELRKKPELREDTAYKDCLNIAGSGSILMAYGNGMRIAKDKTPETVVLLHRRKEGVVVEKNGMYWTRAFAKVPSIPIKEYHIPSDMIDVAVYISVRNNDEFYARFSRQAKPNTQTSIPLGGTEDMLPLPMETNPEPPTTEVTLVDALRAAEKSMETAQQAYASAKLLVSSLAPHVERLVNKIESVEIPVKTDTDETTRTPHHGWPDKGTHIVYFVQGTKTQHIKIGETQNLHGRMRSLRQTSEDLRILGWLKADESTERKLHDKFRAHRTHGEWFSPALEIFQFIVEHTHRVYEEGK